MIFSVLFRVHRVWGKRVVGVKHMWQCSVLLAVWRRYELRLLKLRELFSFADTLADFNAAEQRQPGQQGRVKRPNVHSSAKQNVSLQVVFPLCSAIRRAGRQAQPWWRGLDCFIATFVFPFCKALGRAGRVAWPWPRCLDYLFASCLLTVQCHMPGRADSLALARQYHCSLPPCVPNALPQAGLGVSPGLG